MSAARTNTVLVLFGLVVALLLAESVLRLIGYSNPSFHMVDEDLGSALRPGAEGWWTQEGSAYVKINSDGLRDVEHAIPKPADSVRVAILGDSYAEGLQLPIDKLFWKVLERDLDRCLPKERSVEVINFGVSGYGTGSELLMLRKKVWKYQPDIVILAFLTGNDIRNNSKVLNKVDYVPYFRLENDELVLDKSYLRSAGFKQRQGWFAQLMYSYVNDVSLLQLANDLRHKWRAQQQIWQEQDNAGLGAEVGLDKAIYAPPKTAVWDEAWRVTEALIRQMADEVRAGGARFLLVTLSNGPQVHPDPQTRQVFRERLRIGDLFYPDRRIVNFAEDNEINALMLAPELQTWAERNNICVHGFPNFGLCGGHWNEHAHRLAGQWIADRICRDLL